MTERVAPDSGETLIEILISVAIMGIVMVGMVASLTTATVASDNHRRLTDVEIVARAYGEAVVNQAHHPLETHLTALFTAPNVSNPPNSTVKVSPTAGFTPGTSVSVDGEVAVVASVVTDTSLTFTTALIADHASGTSVSVYQPCPDAASLTVSPFPVSAARVGSPSITQIEYLAQPAGPGVQPVLIASWSGVGTAPSACTTYWDTTGLPCKLDEAPRPHYTACDPPLIRVTVAVNGTEGINNPRRATTTTRVYVNRVNA